MVGGPLSPGTCDKIQWSRILAFRWFEPVRVRVLGCRLSIGPAASSRVHSV